MTTDYLRDVARHMRWADETVWRAVLESDECSADERILDTMYHLHATQHSFLDVWNGADFVNYRRDGASAHEILFWAREFHEGAEQYLATVTNEELGAPRDIPWAKYMARSLGRSPAPVTLGESIHQVVSHSMHHRGQVAARIRELGSAPPIVDYIVWLWLERPESASES